MLRVTTERVPSLAALELVFAGAAVASLFSAHRDGVIARPLWLSDWAWQHGWEPQVVLMACGGALVTALARFQVTSSVEAATEATYKICEAENSRLDSELSMVRYITWAIPSIGFIGTVRGIGDALGQAYKAVEGDISGVTVGLGVAFNSTFVALVLSIIIMFALHQLQLSQERLVLNTQRYIDRHLLRHLSVPRG